MQPVRITYHGLTPSEALTQLIERRAAHLERLSDRISALRVLIDSPHQHHRNGNHYRVRLELTVPGGDLVVGHDDGARTADEDPYQAVRRAFDVLRRRLETLKERREGKQRAHVARAARTAR
jgi:ribosomal subunit interface protein